MWASHPSGKGGGSGEDGEDALPNFAKALSMKPKQKKHAPATTDIEATNYCKFQMKFRDKYNLEFILKQFTLTESLFLSVLSYLLPYNFQF